MTDLIFLRNAISSLESLSTDHNSQTVLAKSIVPYSFSILLGVAETKQSSSLIKTHTHAHYKYLSLAQLQYNVSSWWWPQWYGVAACRSLTVDYNSGSSHQVDEGKNIHFYESFNFTFTFMKVLTSPKLSLYLAMALFLLRLDLHSVLWTIWWPMDGR